MIASLRGTVIDIGLDHAVIERGGVGYVFYAAPTTLAELGRGREGFVHIQMLVKEDALTLYGFRDAESKSMFNILRQVQKIGPKLALTALGTFTPRELAAAIASQDAKLLTTISGVGQKTAERMVHELADKVGGFDSSDTLEGTGAGPSVVGSSVSAQVVVALESLGFDTKAAIQAVDAVVAVDPSAPVSVVLKAALKALSSH